MAQQVLLPKLGLTMETGLIEEWLVEAGAEVHPGDALLRLATDKVNVDVEAEGTGRFHPVVAEGADLPPGTLIGWLLSEGEDVPGGAGTSGAAISGATPTTATAADAPAAAVATDAAGTSSTDGAASDGGRFFVSPNARRLARERGIDVLQLRGTGPNGRVVSADVLDAPKASKPETPATATQSSSGPRSNSPLVRRDAAAAGLDLASIAATGPGGTVRRSDITAATTQRPVTEPGQPLEIVPLTGMRGVIAARMHDSLQQMAQLTLGAEVSMDAAMLLRTQLKQQWSSVGLPVPTITDLIVRAAALAIVAHPRLNATVRESDIVVHSDINVGIAVALDDGLIVPVVRNADRLPLSALATESRRLADAARSGRPALSDLEGGTFTVSTLGNFGIDFFTPVITPGQVAILGVGRLRDSVRWDGDVPVRTQVITLSLTFDHRAVDGAPAAEFLRAVGTHLGAPLSLLA